MSQASTIPRPGACTERPTIKNDAFVAGVIDFSKWARAHRQALTLIGVAVGLLVTGGIYYLNFQRSLTISGREPSRVDSPDDLDLRV